MTKAESCSLVIFGASGDLAKRKLIPALYNLYRRNLLSEDFVVLGVGRTPLDDRSFRGRMAEFLKSGEGRTAEPFLQTLHYRALDTGSPDDYVRISEELTRLRAAESPENILFYLSTPPSLIGSITSGLSRRNLHREDRGWKRVIVEKPFGYDLASARGLNEGLQEFFAEKQIYRIDHYLGKETVQNLLVFRFANGVYEPLWNRNYVDHVEVTAAEKLGVEERGGYYEGTGALRDMFQNHLLHVVGMIATEPPSAFNADSVRNETIKVFDALRPIAEGEVERFAVRGQYTASKVRGRKIAGYREENGVNGTSKTETYVAVKFFIDNWRWAGVPFYVRTGKRLPTRVTEAVVHFRQIPHRLFGRETDQCYGCNQLVIRIQPDEGLLMKFNMKLPGRGFEIKSVNMDFHYSELSGVYTPEAYERLLLDALIGDATLYARSDAVEACWRFVDPILVRWKSDPAAKLYGYPAGTWGPREARDLFDHPDVDWRYPCRNLTKDGEFCEL